MTNCSSTPRCVNCNNNHPSSSTSFPKFSQVRATSRAIEEGRPQHGDRKLTYSQAFRRSQPNEEANPEAEILQGQILAIQTEMYLLRTEWEKIWTVEKKVDHLEDSVSQIQNSLSNPNKGQDSTNNKLDYLLKLIKKTPIIGRIKRHHR